MKITLQTAIKVDGIETSELNLTKPNFGHLVDMQSLIAYKNPSNTSETLHRPRSEAEQTLALIAALSGITEREARSLDMEDVAEIMDFISPFLTSQGKQAKKK